MGAPPSTGVISTLSWYPVKFEQLFTGPKTGLTGYRVPKKIEFRDALPETMVGKVLRRKLIEEEREKAKQV